MKKWFLYKLKIQKSIATRLSDLRRHIDPEADLGISNLRVCSSANGRRLFQIAGNDATEKADMLAELIKKVLSKYKYNANVVRPQGCQVLDISMRQFWQPNAPHSAKL